MTEKPNFLLIMTDQHRADHLGCYGNPMVRTPHIDSIAKRGVAFERAHVASPICMPNRATLMTGRMPSRHGVRHNGLPLSLDAYTFADRLREHGYRTAMVGKSHLQNMLNSPSLVAGSGSGEAVHLAPGRYDQEISSHWRDGSAQGMVEPYYGFDHVDLAIDHADQVDGHYSAWLREHDARGDNLRGPENALPAPGWTVPQAWRTAIPAEFYPTSYVAERTIARMAEFAATPDRPFFLKCSFPDPHHPFTPPGDYWGRYQADDIPVPAAFKVDPDKLPPHVRWLHDRRDDGTRATNTPALFACSEREAREAIALTYAMIEMVDDAVGRILAELDRHGLAQNTVILFTADHGDYMGDHQLLLKGPIHYQGLVRVPLLWSDPARSGFAGGRRSELVGTIDLASTILARAEVPLFNGLQGRSLLPVLDQRAGDWRQSILIEEEGQRTYLGFKSRVRMRSLVSERYRISLYDGADWGELYDLVEDPHEMTNLWSDPRHLGTRAEMTTRLVAEMIAVSETSPSPMGLA